MKKTILYYYTGERDPFILFINVGSPGQDDTNCHCSSESCDILEVVLNFVFRIKVPEVLR